MRNAKNVKTPTKKNANREKNGTGKSANDVSCENLAVLFTGQKYLTS